MSDPLIRRLLGEIAQMQRGIERARLMAWVLYEKTGGEDLSDIHNALAMLKRDDFSAPRSILQGMKFEALSDGFRVTPLEPIDFLGTECFFDGGKVGSWNIEGEIRFTYSAPVPAPRLEWREGAGLESTHWYGVGPNAEDEYDRWTVAHLYETYDVSYAAGRIQKRCKTLDAAKSLAEKLNDVLSPPVGTQEKEN